MGRRFGQHFLSRPSILNAIAEAACPEQVPLVVEIGPGRGALTAALLDRAQRVVAIEIDPVMVLYLRQKFQSQIDEGRLVLVEGDILKTDLGAWGSCVLAGNLPYYITSPILDRVFAAQGQWERAVFLVQAEVAARLVAKPGNRDYGYLTVSTQVFARAERLFEVPRIAFRPPPKVDSTVIRLQPRAAEVEDIPSFLRFAGVCFRHKRKTLRNNLLAAYPKEKLDNLGKIRAEELGIPELAAIQNSLR